MPYRFSALTTVCHCLDNVVANRFILIGKFTFPGRVTYSGVVLGHTFVGVLCQVTELESRVVLVFLGKKCLSSFLIIYVYTFAPSSFGRSGSVSSRSAICWPP